MNFKKSLMLFLILSCLILCSGSVSACENITDDACSLELSQDEVDYDLDDSVEQENSKMITKIDVKNVTVYCKEQITLEINLKDSNNVSIDNKNVSVYFNGKVNDMTLNGSDKIILSYNLKPDTYMGTVKFRGDENYTASESNFFVKVNKIPLSLTTKNFSTYVNSDVFFKAKVSNKLTGKPVSGIRVLFKVYSIKSKKFAYYYRITDENGIATLNKNLKVGTYKISTQIKDSKNKKYISYKNSKNKVAMKVKPTAEIGCCSFYLQVSGTESVAGFRRDGTDAVNIQIKYCKWFGKTAIKQYKTDYGYFFHTITTADGWMIGNGGIEGAGISKAIENLAGDMVKSNKIKISVLKKIKSYKRSLGFGHFSIKAPNGKFAIIWHNGYISGKLKPGEYFSSPNSKSCYRYGTYTSFSDDPVKAAIKVGATDKFGINRRDIVVYHWKSATNKNFKTTSSVNVYAANDDGKLVGKSTSNLKDNIYFKNKFISKNNLPMSPDMKFLGTHNFGSIDKLIKTPTVIKAPEVTNRFNTSQYFKVAIKNKNTKKAVSGINVKFKFVSSNLTKYCTLKTDSNGMIRINTRNLAAGTYAVGIMPANNKYLISAKSKINIV